MRRGLALLPTVARLGVNRALATSGLPGDAGQVARVMTTTPRAFRNGRDEVSDDPRGLRAGPGAHDAAGPSARRPHRLREPRHRGWTAAQDKLAALSTDQRAPRPSTRPTQACSRTRPGATESVRAITQVLSAVRTGSPWPRREPPARPVHPTTAPTTSKEFRCPTRPHTPVLHTEQEGHRTSWALLAVALAAQILVVLDISVVNTALPSIGRDLGLAGGDLQWLVTAYLMMSGGGLLLGGRIADLLSRRGVFLTGLALFTAGLAGQRVRRQRQPSSIAARAVQGLSAALLTPSALALIMTTYAGAQRKTALALWGAVGSLGVAAGVLLGGAVTTWASWQFIFWINGPIGARRPGRRAPRHRQADRDPAQPGATSTCPAPPPSSPAWPPSSTPSAAPPPTAGGPSRPWQPSASRPSWWRSS